MITEKIIDKASNMVFEYDRVSVSLFQEKFLMPYSEADKLMNILESKSIVGPANGAYPRKVLKKKQKVVLEIKLIPGLIMALILGVTISLICILIFR